MTGVGGAAVPGRLSLAGTEARPTEQSLDEIIDSNTKDGFETRPCQSKAISLLRLHRPDEMRLLGRGGGGQAPLGGDPGEARQDEFQGLRGDG